jgi:hypothetical protein
MKPFMIPPLKKLRTGYVLQYIGCPIIWGSKLQTEIALSSTVKSLKTTLGHCKRHEHQDFSHVQNK